MMACFRMIPDVFRAQVVGSGSMQQRWPTTIGLCKAPELQKVAPCSQHTRLMAGARVKGASYLEICQARAGSRS
jgi:hypothetical protein